MLRRWGPMLVAVALAAAGCSKDEQPKEDEQPAAEAPAAAAPQVKTIEEVEPNERTDQAMPVTEACVVEASLEAAAGEDKRASDWYRIAPAGTKMVRLAVSGVAGEDLQLNFLDADKNRLFRVDAGGVGEGEVYANLILDREAYMRVYGSKGGKGGAYELKVQMQDPQAGHEVEPNDRYSMASALAVGDRVEGYLTHPADEDWYRLALGDLPTGSVLRIDLTAVEGVRFGLEVVGTEEQVPIMKASSPEQGKGVVIRNLGVPGTPEAVYLVVKSAWVPGPKPKKYIQTHNADATYALSVSSEAGGDDLEREPNDKPEEAITLLDGQKIRGYLGAPDDVDWYRIEVERPSILSAELSALDRVDLQLYVVDPEKKDQRRDFELVRINDGKVAEPETLTNCALKPGDNYLRVEGAWKNVDGKWVRDFVNLDETYELTVNLRTDEGKEEREPNDELEKATGIAPGQTLRGTLHPKRDVDFFRLDLSDQNGPRQTVIECTGIPKVDVAITLLGPERDEKGKPKVVASSSRGKGEAKEEIAKELLPGEYHILVRGQPRSESNARDQYVLTVTQP